MDIQGIEITKDCIGSRVTYVPSHAHDDIEHADCESGFITSWNDTFVFVCYGKGGGTQATNAYDLVWG